MGLKLCVVIIDPTFVTICPLEDKDQMEQYVVMVTVRCYVTVCCYGN